MTYLEGIALTRILPCLAEPGRIIVIGQPSRTLDDVLPYLAMLPGVLAWNPEMCTLTFRRRPGFMTLYPGKVYMTQIKDAEEGIGLLKALTDAINATWEHRNELVAASGARRAPRLMDIWSLLPKMNCKQCGEPTCYAFAIRLTTAQKELSDCPPLFEPGYTENLAVLQEMVNATHRIG